MREVIIRILGETTANPNPATADKAKEKDKPNSKSKNDTEFESFELYVMNNTVNVIKQNAIWAANKYLEATENYKAGELVQNATQTISMVQSIFHGASFGYKVAGGAGAMVGVAAATANATINAYKKYVDSMKQITENAYGNYFYGERAGFYTGGHGTEN